MSLPDLHTHQAGQSCGCCTGAGTDTGTSQTAVAPPRNRAGLDALRYRLGTHPAFFDAMIARLSRADAPALAALRTRDLSDPGIALLDAWALVSDVLTFYQERIANEGFLRTATERRSVLELAWLIGYEPRPGVSASVYLAYTLEKDSAPVTIGAGARAASVPAPGEQMQTFETADALEARLDWNRLAPRRTEPQTASSIAAKGLYLKGTALNLKPNDPLLIDLADGKGPRLTRIETVEVDHDAGRTRVVLRDAAAFTSPQLMVAQAAVRFSAVDAFDVSADAAMTKRVLALLAEASDLAAREPSRLQAHLDEELLPKLEAELAIAQERHFTKLEPWIAAILDEVRSASFTLAGAATTAPPPVARLASPAGGTDKPEDPQAFAVGAAVEALKRPPSVPPFGPRQLARAAGRSFETSADTLPRVLASLQPSLRKTLYAIVKQLPPRQATAIEVHAFRVAAAPFGHNAPLRVTDLSGNLPVFDEWQIDDPLNHGGNGAPPPIPLTTQTPPPNQHTPQVLFLDGDYTIAPDSLMAIETVGRTTILIPRAESIVPRSLAAYGLSGKTVQVTLRDGQSWLQSATTETFATVRNTRVFTGSELLELAEVPVTTPVAGAEIELDQLYEDLEPGRWLIVTGERADLLGPDDQPLPGVKTGELVMLAAVAQKRRLDDQGVEIPGDRTHTFLTLSAPLAYSYARETVAIYGNVVRATNGETVQEVLGSGDAATALQRFPLKRPPLTFVSAPTVSGVSSTLEVRVNDVRWHEARSLASLGATDRSFITRTDDDAKTTVVFGNGVRGARVPTGTENVTAIYRAGIGKGGNSAAGQITLLTTRPLGVKDVINPLRASGGADKEDRDQARWNAPLAVAALDRLVSTRDYADFARTFAGVGKAAAVRLSDGRRQLVSLTIAGTDDIPIDVSSDLFRNLGDALHRFGDPYVPIRLDVRERLALVVSANVKTGADYPWETVEPRIRAALLRAFGFARIGLGRDLLLADAIAAVQRIVGVSYVDVDVFDLVSEAQLLAGFASKQVQTLARRERLSLAPARVEQRVVRPAQLAYLSPDVPDTLILQEIKP
jgi:hypothetical protein